MVRGFQGEDPSQPDRIAACAKHFAGYGAAEGGRDYNTTWIPEGLLRDVYLPPFRACVEAGVHTFMSAFNDLNGVPASGNPFLFRQVLRAEWGFRGFVVSDWASLEEMLVHGVCADKRARPHSKRWKRAWISKRSAPAMRSISKASYRRGGYRSRPSTRPSAAFCA